jgi:hypothetical protein
MVKFKFKPEYGVVLILLFLGIILYYKPLSGSYTFSGPDTLAPSALNAGLRQAHQETGEWPLWNPWIFSGMPTVHAFTGVSRLYLPNLLGRTLSTIGLPGFWMFLLHLMFAGLGCYFLLRRIGGSFYAGLLGGTGFMLMPYINTMVVHGHGSQMMTLVYLPWIIWALLRLYDRPTFGSSALLALVAGLQLQRGHAQIAYYSLMLLGLCFIVMVIRSWRDPERSTRQRIQLILLFTGAMAVAFGLALALFMPVMNYAPYSIRGASGGGGTGFEYATQWSFSLGETLTFLLPSFYGFGGVTYWGNMPFTDYPNYMGILILALAVWAVAKRGGWFVWTLAGAGILAWMLSLGNHFFLYKVFYAVMPYFNKFRVPSMLLVLTQFSTVILAGIGLDALVAWIGDRKPEQARRILIGSAIGVIVLTVIFLLSASLLEGTFPAPRGIHPQLADRVNDLRMSMIQHDALVMLAIGGLAVAALFLWRRQILPYKWLLGGLVLLSMVDLGRIDKQIIEPSHDSFRISTLQPKTYLQRYVQRDQVMDFLAVDTSTFRIFPLGDLMNENRWAAAGIQSVMGYHPAKLANYDRFIQGTGFGSLGIMRMLNVKYLVSQRRFSDSRFNEVFTGNLYFRGKYQPTVVYELNEPLDRAWFPARVEFQEAPEDILKKIREADYNPEERVFLQPPPVASGNWPKAGAGRIIQMEWGTDDLRLIVEADSLSLLVVSEVYYPKGWVATIDAEPARIHEVNGLLRGVMVPAGEHEVVMTFKPKDWRLGRFISRFSLFVILLGLAPGAISKGSELIAARRKRE